MMKQAGVQAEVRLDLSLSRKVDIPMLVGSHEKITAATGWKPEISFDLMLSRLLAYWETRVNKTA